MILYSPRLFSFPFFSFPEPENFVRVPISNSSLNTLKRIQIGSSQPQNLPERGIDAERATFLLSSCPHLIQAILKVSFSRKSFDSLQQKLDELQGCSNLKDLAVRFEFIWDERLLNTWWGTSSEKKSSTKYRLGSKKMRLATRFLSLTRNLESLEVWMEDTLKREKDWSQVDEGCLVGLNKSQESLRQLRLRGFAACHSTKQDQVFDYSTFKNLKILNLDFMGLHNLSHRNKTEYPLSVEVLSIEFYHPDQILKQKLSRGKNIA